MAVERGASRAESAISSSLLRGCRRPRRKRGGGGRASERPTSDRDGRATRRAFDGVRLSAATPFCPVDRTSLLQALSPTSAKSTFTEPVVMAPKVATADGGSGCGGLSCIAPILGPDADPLSTVPLEYITKMIDEVGSNHRLVRSFADAVVGVAARAVARSRDSVPSARSLARRARAQRGAAARRRPLSPL